jgi:hypothetical protein
VLDSGPNYSFNPAVVAAVVISLAGLVAALAIPARGDAQSAAAVFPPWWSPAQAFAAAGSVGEVTRTGALSSIVIVRSEEPALADRLRKAGAVFVLDPVQLALCKRFASQGTMHE